jgi:hypothetical protein
MKFPKGKYWIGDPCYVIGAEGWNWQHHTYLGDGAYDDQDGREYLVDSGTLGCFPAGAVEADVTGGQFVYQPKAFEPLYVDGTFIFGVVEIPT